MSQQPDAPAPAAEVQVELYASPAGIDLASPADLYAALELARGQRLRPLELGFRPVGGPPKKVRELLK
jgi:hypothetical protein